MMKDVNNRYSITVIFICTLIMCLVIPATSFSQNVHPDCCDYPVAPDAIKIQFFLEACSVPGGTARGMIPFFDCQSYVLGAIDSYRIATRGMPPTTKACIPENITTRVILELIIKAYPNWDIPGERGASGVIFEVLKKEYPCGKVSMPK